MKRIEGRCFTAGASSVPFSSASTWAGADGPDGGVVVDDGAAGVGPGLLRTVNCGVVVSARFLVISAGVVVGVERVEGAGEGV